MRIVHGSGRFLDDFDLKIETLKKSATENYLSDYVISIKDQKEYCVGRADMINAHKISAMIGPRKAARYHQLFLNSISYVLDRFDGYVIKNVDNSVLFYFPTSEKNDSKFGFLSCIECGLSMTSIHEKMCKNAAMHGLPRIDYCISADYGRVAIIDSNESEGIDLLGSPMNHCSKINNKTSPNEFVIGKDLYDIIKDFDDYEFTLLTDQTRSEKEQVYKVTRKDREARDV